MAEVFNNDSATSLVSAIGAGDTVIPVVSSQEFNTSGTFRIRIDDEIMAVTSVSGNNWTVTRAAESCEGAQAAAVHAANSAVYGVLTVAALSGLGGGGDGSVTLSGDVTGSGTGSVVTTISAHAVTYAKLQTASPRTIIGNPTGSTATPQEITLGTNLSFSGSVLNAINSGGTVTSVSIFVSGGIMGNVTNPTTTPTINLSLGAITPTSVAATGTVTGSNLSGTNTGNQTITLTGPVTGSGTGTFATSLTAGAVLYTNIQTESGFTLLGNPLISSGQVQEVALGTNLNFSGGVLNAVAPAQILHGYIDGFNMLPRVSAPNTLDFTSGQCSDSTNANMLSIGAYTKILAGAWTAGSGNNGLFSGARASSTFYHVFAIAKAGAASPDIGFDTSVNASNIPATYTMYRRIGTVLTDSGGSVLAFHQYGDEFWYDTSIFDVNATNPGTGAVTRTLSVPTGIKVQAILDVTVYDSNASSVGQVYLSALDATDQGCVYVLCVQSTATNTQVIEGYGAQRIWTNTSGQIRTRTDFTSSSSTTLLKIRTRGYVDLRGKNQ